MSGMIFIAFVLHVLISPGTGEVGERLPYGPEMVEIPAGSFRMGCVSGRDCVDGEHPVHEVRIEAFELSKFEVTFEEYDRFTEATGRAPAEDEGWGRGRRPVINVSWADAVAYTNWLSGRLTGQRPRVRAIRVPARVHHRRDLRHRHPGGPDQSSLNAWILEIVSRQCSGE